MRRLLKHLRDWLDSLLDMGLRFDGDLMTPDWCEGDGDPHYRPERATIKRSKDNDRSS